MSKAVFDASAVLAYVNNEPGADAFSELLIGGGLISTVNWTEVLAKVTEAGLDPEQFVTELSQRGILGELLEVIPFDEEQALEAARLRPLTRSLGLSLADRACLALGGLRSLPVYTTDRVWERLDFGIEVRLLR